MSYAVVLAMLYLMHLILKMNWYVTSFLAVYSMAAVFFHRKMSRQKIRQEERFFEASVYMETLLYAFQKEGKIDAALQDAMDSLPQGRLQQTVEAALLYMHMTFDESEVVTDAFEIIEAKYRCNRIRTIHEFMLNVENYGGEIRQSASLLLEDKNRWESRIRRSMEERKKMFRDVVLSVAVSLLVCGMVLYLPVMNVDISSNLLTQILTAVVVVLDDVILFLGQRYQTVDWLTIDVADTSDEEKRMEEYKSYDPQKECRLSIIMALISAVFVAFCFATARSWWAAGGLFLVLVGANQHRIGQYLRGKNLKKSIKRAFPNWLLELALLLQSENVPVALEKSKEHVPPVLKSELENLVERLAESPEEAEPYHEFLGGFRLPEISAAMSMLYSLAAGTGDSTTRQMGDLIGKNFEMLDVAEEERMKDKNSGLYLLFLAPVLTASFKLVVDMAVFMLTFLSAPLT
jgi:hypothetical protein